MNSFNDFNNPQVAKLPKHLKQFIVDQNYEKYTSIDHAIWRYVMRQNYSYLKDVAYYPYIPGLKKAGLTIEKIPSLQEMNDNLIKIGWGAVTVDGFIPPAAFMEYQAYKVLVIAADIRQIHHIEYTPAPDIIHESAGHAPIIAEPEYAEYLRYIGEIGSKAMFSSKDFDLYEAIRHLSILKEMQNADPLEISKAEKDLEYKQNNLGEPSEMALLSRLHWWSVEYGLIGTLENPKIFGAGLLSSIGESVSCMKPDVKKLPYNLDTINYSYDITKPQPQLFVTPDFQNLIDVLEAFANTMSFRVGGSYGLYKAIESKNVSTAILSSGIAITGIFSDMVLNQKDEPVFIKTNSPTALSFNNKEIPKQDKKVHHHGFSTVLGKLKNYSIPLEEFQLGDLKNIGLVLRSKGRLEFESGFIVEGVLIDYLEKNGKLILLSFENCKVWDENSNIVYFEPSWGNYDMAIGEKIASVYCGAADKESFNQDTFISENKTVAPEIDSNLLDLQKNYQTIRAVRERKIDATVLPKIYSNTIENHKGDWLSKLEILEILCKDSIYFELQEEIRLNLIDQGEKNPEIKKLIKDGLTIIQIPVN